VTRVREEEEAQLAEDEESELTELVDSLARESEVDQVADRRPLAFKIVHPKKGRLAMTRGPRTLFPLSMLSSMLGFVSLALPWFYVAGRRDYDVFSLFRHIIEVGEYSTMYSVIAWLVLAGSIICLVSSIGALFQLAGVLLFATEISDISGGLAAGPFVAVAATLVGMAGLVVSARLSVPSRAATFTLADDGGLSVNLLGFSAFLLGLISLFTCLFYSVEGFSLGPSSVHENSYSQLSFLFDTRFDELSIIIAGVTLVFVGTLVCLLTPLGALLQITGVVLAFSEVSSAFRWIDVGGIYGEVHLGAGFYLAIAAGAAGVWSMVYVRRVTLPPRFVSALLVPSRPSVEEDDQDEQGSPQTEIRSRLSRVMDVIPRGARIPFAAAITLAIIIAALAVPYGLGLSTVEVWVSPAYQESVDVDVYIDGDLVGSGVASPFESFKVSHRVRAGIHTVGMDYSYEGADEPGPDGVLDWTSSVKAPPYMRVVKAVILSGWHDVSLPSVVMSSAPSGTGYVVTLEEVVYYNPYGEAHHDVEWSQLSLVVAEDSLGGVIWRFSSIDLDSGPMSTHDYGTEYIGELGLNCTATDVIGNGRAGVGDFLAITVVDGAFLEPADYTAYLVDRYSGSVIGEVPLSD
jgi:hypothetical protein